MPASAQTSEGAPARTYLDYGATAPMDPRVLDAMMPWMGGSFGNASSLYSEGKRAAAALLEARTAIAAGIGCRDPHDVVLTSGATESNNAAIFGIARARFAKMKKTLGPGHVICSSFEHKAVLEPVDQLRRLGHEVTFLEPRRDGFVSPDDLDAAIRPDTLLVSMMLANNEIGTVQPIVELAEVAHDHGVPIHSDAVAAFGKVPVDVARAGLDSISFASHKICGPAGIGGLYISKSTPFVPLIWGGGQERGLRSGTSNVAGAVGFAKAVELAMSDIAEGAPARMAEMRDNAICVLASRAHGAIRPAVSILAGDTRRHLPQLVPLLVQGIGSQELVRSLDSQGYAVSGGSACTSSAAAENHVLASIGIHTGDGLGFARATMGRFTKPEELRGFANAIAGIVENQQGA